MDLLLSSKQTPPKHHLNKLFHFSSDCVVSFSPLRFHYHIPISNNPSLSCSLISVFIFDSHSNFLTRHEYRRVTSDPNSLQIPVFPNNFQLQNPCTSLFWLECFCQYPISSRHVHTYFKPYSTVSVVKQVQKLHT